jgi:hypothetical protein
MWAKTLLALDAEDEAHGVDPVRADVAHGAEFAALAGEHAPVVVGLMQQPVLEEVALHVDDPAEVAARDHRAHLQHGGEEAAHVVHREDGPFLPPFFTASTTFESRRGHAERLFADDVLAHLERLEALLDMNLVRRGDVDDIDVRRGIHGLMIVVAIDLGDAPELAGFGSRALLVDPQMAVTGTPRRLSASM